MKLRKATRYEQFQWLRYRRNPDDPGLTLKYRFELAGNIDFQVLNEALKVTLLNGFNCLLSFFSERDDALLVGCYRLPDRVVDIVTDKSQWMHSEPIDPAGDKLFRFTCFTEDNKVTGLKLEFSHLVFDGECYQPFINTLSDYWRRRERLDDQGREETKISFTQIGETPVNEASVDYWKANLQGARLSQTLPFCFKTPKEKGVYLSVKRTLAINPTLAAKPLPTGIPALDEGSATPIGALLEQRDLTLFQFVVAVTAAVIKLYSATEDHDEERVTIAHTVNCRGEQQAFGCFTNLIPLFVKVNPDQDGAALLNSVKQARQAVRPHQHTPTLQWVEWADPRANHGGRLLNLVVNASDGLVPYAAPALTGCQVKLSERPDTGGQNDLAINFSCDGDQLFLSFDSSSRFMARETLTALADNFVKVAAFLASSPERPLRECRLSQPLTPVSCGERDESTPHTRILERVAHAARLYAKAPAISDERTNLTYGQTCAAIGRLYSEIMALLEAPANVSTNVSTNAFAAHSSIGVFLERTVALPVAYLSALACQRAFTPMDPLLPDERLSYMMDVAKVGVLLVDARTRARAETLFPGAAIINVDASLALAIQESVSVDGIELALVTNANPDATAYVMFTSGSTGRPKGVAISAGNLANFLLSMQASPGFQAGERMLALTPISFDISILELLLPLMCGGELHIVSDQTRVSAELLGDALNQWQADVAQATPSTWRMLQQAGWRAAGELTILCGGEALDKELAQYLLQQTGQLYNMYGPTEATIWASCRRVTDADRIPLGRPVFNSDYYILDAEGDSVLPGMQGELTIAGECVGKGYLNAPSEQAFVTLPNGVRAYKTGDIVHYLSHQDIEYVGRRDSQYKVNGYRVDTGEVSHRLKEFAPDAAVFTVVRHKPEAHLCCFVWAPESSGLDIAVAMQWLQRALPYYMAPKALHRLSRIPLTANGKADVKLLSEAPLADLPLATQPLPASPAASETALQEPGLQQEIRNLLLEKLDVTAPDLDQPLGWLGLNSISYNLLAAAIQQRFGIRFRSYEFYQFNTINEVAGAVRQRQSPQRIANSQERRIDRRRDKNQNRNNDDRLAIVGMAATLPGGDDAESFWRALLDRKDCIAAAPADRSLSGYRAGYISSVRRFDARFFSISPLEATRMDPRQRMLLQAAWRALEDAGYAPSQLAGERIGCYMAATGSDYALLQARDGEKQTPYSLSGHSLSILANRISAFFDWNGPSFTLDTACSGALTALVKACRDLQSRVCDAAMVGGVNLILDAQINEGLEAGRFMSPDSRCATFDASANGYVRGEGVGCFMVKRLQDAQADGDLIHAVIESVAENHGGKANSLTAPNPNAQYRLLLDAYTPELAQRVSYIETHGTGTRLGDPIEVAALKRALQELTDGNTAQTVWLGAVKSNIGHLEPAAGVASVVKVIKAFEHEQLPANLHFQHLNPEIDLSASPFQVLADAIPWRSEHPLTAGVSSFGFGGANAHVVLSAPPRRERRAVSQYHKYLIPVSARTAGALQKQVAALAHFVAERRVELGESGLLDLAFTLSNGREHFEHRHAWLVSGVDELLTQLRSGHVGVHAPRHGQSQNEPSEDNHTLAADEATAPGSLDDLACLAQLQSRFLQGLHIDWRRLYEGAGGAKIRLPTYVFDERDYWYTKNQTGQYAKQQAGLAQVTTTAKDGETDYERKR
ncbi:Polyketide synthase modules and related protein [Hahella chejuensis KCTC 2396]|uniref:Polyketide synthase modules and related protein n=1 Tax=Hahella chejuensis (strain KCTC 2396) TaxID=349521 RepID=Q2SGI7_HAHCH|nr:beta-ketoacyl synthase N-terminal-like domain-containing protein [Hahella chejuensis]ABC30237.1 Polyketide synthase modules and related protein [Hahella chejuensis KCTC 2396]